MPLDSLSELYIPDGLILHEPSPKILVTIIKRFQNVTLFIVTPSTQHLQPSSKLNFATIQVLSQPLAHDHITVNLNLFDRHPNWSFSAHGDGPNGVKGATEEDKNRR